MSGGEEGGAVADPAGEGKADASTEPVLAAGEPEEKGPTGEGGMATAKLVNKNKTDVFEAEEEVVEKVRAFVTAHLPVCPTAVRTSTP